MQCFGEPYEVHSLPILVPLPAVLKMSMLELNMSVALHGEEAMTAT